MKTTESGFWYVFARGKECDESFWDIITAADPFIFSDCLQGCWAAVLASSHALEEQNANHDTVKETPEDTNNEKWRKRRHHIMSKLLLSSAELLMLESDQAQAFEPMLDNLLEGAPETSSNDNSSSINNLNDSIRHQIDQIGGLRPFLETMEPGVAYRCLCLLLIQVLLQSEHGYDARVRHAMKTLGVVIFLLQEVTDQDDSKSYANSVTKATRKFESLEQSIALHLILLSQKANSAKEQDESKKPSKEKPKWQRNLKIGGAAVAAGTLFAVTGGLAAPGIAAGIAAIAGGTVLGATAATLLASSVAVTTIFGVGGGGLAAYKMSRRTQGLCEFEIQRETGCTVASGKDDELVRPELFRTIAVSGWLRDECDFQKPWGVMPSNPPITDSKELLERFYSVYSPEQLPDAAKQLALYKGRESDLWELLEKTYGRKPSNMFPLQCDSRDALTDDEEEIVRKMFVDLGSPVEEQKVKPPPRETPPASLHPLANKPEAKSNSDDEKYTPPKHLASVYDYQTTYGGELYTVKFESVLIKNISDSTANLVRDLVGKEGTKQIIKFTAMATLMTAVALPALLVSGANMIDGNWSLIRERSDEAGIELARSLLYSRGGNRPVTLVGFSFGARAIYSCLNELARYQELWEEYHERKGKTKGEKSKGKGGKVPDGKEEEDDDFESMREPACIVEDAILMGIPKQLNLPGWEACRQVVNGRLVNCFSQKDLVLSLMFRAKQMTRNIRDPVCGVCPVTVRGVENIDVTDLVSSHHDYCLKAGDVLKRVRHGQPFCSISTSYASVVDEAASATTAALDNETEELSAAGSCSS
jgi:hypothetical protein